MFSQLSNKKVIIGAVIVALSVIGIILLFTHPKPSTTSQSSSGRYYDPNSHQVVSNPNGKGPDTYGTNQDMPLFLGFSNLLDSGLTTDQLAALKTAFYNYSISTKSKIKEVSVAVGTIQHKGYDPNNPSPDTVTTFDVVLDRKTTLHAKIQWTELSSLELLLYQNNVQVYDSGVIKGAS